MIRGGVRRFFHLALRRRDRWEREVEDEIKLHLALRAEQFVAHGATPDEACREAMRRFGPLDESRARLLDAARHREQHMRRTEYLSDLWQDLTFAVRTLRRERAWTVVVILTLALGIGATTAVFSVVSSLMLHPLPYPNADRVMLVAQQPTTGNMTGIQVSVDAPPPLIKAWRSGARSFESLEPFRPFNTLMQTNGEPSQLRAAQTLPSFATFAGQRALHGRLYDAGDIERRDHVVVLSEQLWVSRFGADASVIGKRITLDDSIYTVIGIAPAALRLPTIGLLPTDVWLPLDLGKSLYGIRNVGRLRTGVTPTAAARELDSLSLRSGVYPGPKLPLVATVTPPARLISFRESLMMLSAAVALVLLVACANVAHLLLARAAARHRELAIRAALGAGRRRLFRQLLTESLMLSLAGAALGVFVGWIGLRAMLLLRPAELRELRAAHLDGTTVIVAVSVAVLCGIAFGVLGAFQSARQSTHDALKSGALSASHSRRHDRLRALLVVSEMALSGVLMVGAALLVRSVINMRQTDLGFEPRGLYAISLSLPSSRYATPASRESFVQELTTRLHGLRGVRDIAMAGVAPGSFTFILGTLEIEGEPAPPANSSAYIADNNVEPAFFRTMGIRFVEGGVFTDTSKTSNQIVVNNGFARKHWPRGGVEGHRLRVVYGGQGNWMTIVGVVADAMVGGPVRETSAPMLYSTGDHQYLRAILIRTDGTADPLTPIRSLLRSMDPHMMSSDVSSIEQMMGNSIAEPRFTMVLLTAFTGLALLLAAIGLYGVMSYSVAQRTREIGIRIALGATRSNIASVVVVRGLILTALGAAAGLAGAYWGTRMLGDLLYGVTPLDLPSFAVGAGVLFAAAVLACLVPMRRAVRVDPIAAIRTE